MTQQKDQSKICERGFNKQIQIFLCQLNSKWLLSSIASEAPHFLDGSMAEDVTSLILVLEQNPENF